MKKNTTIITHKLENWYGDTYLGTNIFVMCEGYETECYDGDKLKPVQCVKEFVKKNNIYGYIRVLDGNEGKIIKDWIKL